MWRSSSKSKMEARWPNNKKDSNTVLYNVIGMAFFSWKQDILSVRNEGISHTAELPHQPKERFVFSSGANHVLCLPSPFLFKEYFLTLPQIGLQVWWCAALFQIQVFALIKENSSSNSNAFTFYSHCPLSSRSGLLSFSSDFSSGKG